MPIELNHTIVPSRDKVAAAEFFARLFGLEYRRRPGHFAAVRVNATLTLDFADEESFESHHYAFHVDDETFDAIFGRVRAESIPYGSGPRSATDMRTNSRKGGRGVYFRDPDGHLLELMTKVYRPSRAGWKMRSMGRSKSAAMRNARGREGSYLPVSMALTV